MLHETVNPHLRLPVFLSPPPRGCKQGAVFLRPNVRECCGPTKKKRIFFAELKLPFADIGKGVKDTGASENEVETAARPIAIADAFVFLQGFARDAIQAFCERQIEGAWFPSYVFRTTWHFQILRARHP